MANILAPASQQTTPVRQRFWPLTFETLHQLRYSIILLLLTKIDPFFII
jgi:hypothetical protein